MNAWRFFNLIFCMLICSANVNADDQIASDVTRGTRESAIVDGFLERLAKLDSDRRAQAIQAIEDYSDSPTDALTEGLVALYPKYGEAVAASDDDELEQAVAQLTPLLSDEDKYLSADATFFLARTYMNHRRYEDAIGHLEKLTSSLGDFSVHQGPAQYFLGLAQAGLLKKDEAYKSFAKFLNENPNAPERLRVSAWRQSQKLNQIEDGKLEDIHWRMDFSRRRLDQQQTDQSTQQQQDQIVKMLSKLIKEAEKKEASGSPSNTKKPQRNQPKPNQQAQKKPSAPKPSQKGKQGGSSSQPNGKAVVKNYDESPASPWSRLRDRSRDPANNAVKEKLPARYRDIVERYMEAANGDAEKK